MTTEPVQKDQTTSEPQHTSRKEYPWGWGIILILLGVFFMSRETGLIGRQFHWWAFFIFLPAIGSFTAAWNAIHQSGRFNAAARSALGSGLVISTVAFIFLYGLDWGIWWPLMVIAAGIAFILGGLPDERLGFKTGKFLALGLWIGIAMAGLGLGFLLENLEMVIMSQVFGRMNWWAIFILLPGIGALINAWLVYHHENKLVPAAIGLLGMGVAVLSVGILALLGLSWSLLSPVILIAVGITFLLSTLLK
jgi:hypothetical protein